MPNHVTTRYLVTGPRADLKRFKLRAFRINDAKEKSSVSRAFIPMPAEIAKAQDDSLPDKLETRINGTCSPRSDSVRWFSLISLLGEPLVK